MADLPNGLQNKYEKLPKSVIPQVREQVKSRIDTFKSVIAEHEANHQKNLEEIKKHLKEAEDDLRFLEDGS
jgi:predicted secreted Zn-dependent protease